MLRPVPSHPLLDRLWDGYVADVPWVARFARLNGEGPIVNDHIALRSLAREGAGSGLAIVVPVFERLGWQVREAYTFADVHLDAVYLARPGLPRVFVSELRVEALPDDVAAAIRRAPPDPPPPTDLDALAAWFGPPPPPSREDVERVERVSQYGAWCLCFGRRVNHFTAAVADVGAWQHRLIADGVPMKATIEGDPVPPGGRGLRQTATAAADVDVRFADGSVARRPYAYFEIAERHGGFDGFLATQARQLFDQTSR